MKQGPCPGFCGADGYCCRVGWEGGGCDGKIGGQWGHHCAAASKAEEEAPAEPADEDVSNGRPLIDNEEDDDEGNRVEEGATEEEVDFRDFPTKEEGKDAARAACKHKKGPRKTHHAQCCSSWAENSLRAAGLGYKSMMWCRNQGFKKVGALSEFDKAAKACWETTVCAALSPHFEVTSDIRRMVHNVRHGLDLGAFADKPAEVAKCKEACLARLMPGVDDHGNANSVLNPAYSKSSLSDYELKAKCKKGCHICTGAEHAAFDQKCQAAWAEVRKDLPSRR